MRNLFFLLLISIFSISMYSCDSNDIECIRASSNIISESRDIKDFNSVIFNAVGEVKLTQSQDFSFSISGPDNVVELTTTEIQNDLLVIGSEKCFNGNYNLDIEISAPSFEYVNLVGVGRMETVGFITGNSITIDIFGVGEVEADIRADSLYTNVTGQSEIVYGGEVDWHQTTAAGTFQLKAFNLETKNTFVDIQGIGDCEVNAAESLAVKISGEGNVYYKGNPQVQTDITGEGDVIDSN